MIPLFLEINNVTKVFKKNKNKFTAFNNINIGVEKGEFLCILGPSGCGKTTLFNIIAGLDHPTEGKIILDGKEVKKAGAERAVVFQEGALFPWLTVFQNIEFGMKLKYRDKEERKNRVKFYLEKVRLQDFASSYVHELSGGMKQRVAIARAFALESEILLMDEPFSALDDYNRSLLQRELLYICRETGKTVLFITHNIEEAFFLGNRVLLMTDSPGRIAREFKYDENLIEEYIKETKRLLGENDNGEEQLFKPEKNRQEHYFLPDSDSLMESVL